MSETPIAYTQQQMQIAYLRSVISQRDPEYAQMPDYVPTRIRVLRDIESDTPWMRANGHVLNEGEEYDCKTNRWGAMAVPMPDGSNLGVKLHECEILRMGPNNKKAIMAAEQAKKENVSDGDDTEAS